MIMIDIGRYCMEREIHAVSSFCVCLKMSLKNFEKFCVLGESFFDFLYLYK